jgi:hypothetical protein
VSDVDSHKWWAERRFRYNLALNMAGASAFLCYALAFEARCRNVAEAEITLATTVIQGMGYLLAIVIANGFYNLGYWSELWVKPKDPARFRARLFRLGLVFSVTLPFVIPVSTLLFGCVRGAD